MSSTLNLASIDLNLACSTPNLDSITLNFAILYGPKKLEFGHKMLILHEIWRTTKLVIGSLESSLELLH